MNGYNATEDGVPFLDENLETDYTIDDGSQVVNYYIFDTSDADISNIPFENAVGWEDDDQIKDFYSMLNVPEDKRPRNVTKMFHLTESNDYPAYIWLLLDGDNNKLYVMEVLH